MPASTASEPCVRFLPAERARTQLESARADLNAGEPNVRMVLLRTLTPGGAAPTLTP